MTAQHTGGGKAEQYFLRGLDADRGTGLAVYFDGVPMNLRSHAHGQGFLDLHFVVPEAIARLDAYKGPYFARFGDFATAAAIEYVPNDAPRNPLRALRAGGSARGASSGGFHPAELDVFGCASGSRSSLRTPALSPQRPRVERSSRRKTKSWVRSTATRAERRSRPIYRLGPHTWGDPGSPLTLTCDWRGPAPVLQSFYWADQPERVALLRAAAAALPGPAPVETLRAGAFLERALAALPAGAATVVHHSSMW